MNSAFVAALIGLALAGVALVFAVPIRRTWRQEHGKPLAMPGPEVEPQEQVPDPEPPGHEDR